MISPVSLFHGVSPKKTQVPPNRPKGILSCRASKVVFVVKIVRFANFVDLIFFSYYMVKNEFQIYIHVGHELAHSPTCFFFILHLYKKFFLRHTGDL